MRLRGQLVACVAWQLHVIGRYCKGGRIGGLSQDLPSYPSSSSSNPTKVSALMSAMIMPLQLDAVQHILIKRLLREGFETKLIASEALCTVRAVQRIYQ